MGRSLGKDLETNQTGSTGKVGDGNSGYEDKGTFRRDPEWILLQFKCRVVTSESGLKSFECLVETLSPAAATGSAGPREPSRCTGYPACRPRIRKVQDRSVCHMYRIDRAARAHLLPGDDPALPPPGLLGEIEKAGGARGRDLTGEHLG